MNKKFFSAAAVILLLLFPLCAHAADLPVTSAFGWRIHPISGAWKFHTGVDLGYAEGTPIPALFDGVVVECGNKEDGYGNQVLLHHPYYDVYTRYAHMAAVYVRADQYVAQGDWWVRPAT